MRGTRRHDGPKEAGTPSTRRRYDSRQRGQCQMTELVLRGSGRSLTPHGNRVLRGFVGVEKGGDSAETLQPPPVRVVHAMKLALLSGFPRRGASSGLEMIGSPPPPPDPDLSHVVVCALALHAALRFARACVFSEFFRKRGNFSASSRRRTGSGVPCSCSATSGSWPTCRESSPS